MSRNSCTFSECAGILGLVDHGAQSRYHQAHGKTERTSYFGCRLAVHADRGADGVGEFVGAGQEVAAGGRATRGATRGADCGAGRAIGASTGSRQRIATLGGNGDFAQETSQASFLGSFAGWSAGPPRPWAHALAGGSSGWSGAYQADQLPPLPSGAVRRRCSSSAPPGGRSAARASSGHRVSVAYLALSSLRHIDRGRMARYRAAQHLRAQHTSVGRPVVGCLPVEQAQHRGRCCRTPLG